MLDPHAINLSRRRPLLRNPNKAIRGIPVSLKWKRKVMDGFGEPISRSRGADLLRSIGLRWPTSRGSAPHDSVLRS